jgi:hypothetical protein
MLYQCLTTDNLLKAGRAIAKISLINGGKLKLSLDWEWLTNENEKNENANA